jgi:hypothetical protein
MQKRSNWNYNGYTWVHQDGRCLTRVSGYKPQAASDKPQAASNKHLTNLNKGLYRRYESKRNNRINNTLNKIS